MLIKTNDLKLVFIQHSEFSSSLFTVVTVSHSNKSHSNNMPTEKEKKFPLTLFLNDGKFTKSSRNPSFNMLKSCDLCMTYYHPTFTILPKRLHAINHKGDIFHNTNKKDSVSFF